jgi:trk system potassium uptake protein TrkH
MDLSKLKKLRSIVKAEIKETPFFWVSVLAIVFVVFDIGFKKSFFVETLLENFFLIILIFGSFSIVYRYVNRGKKRKLQIWIFDFLSLLLFLFLIFIKLDWIQPLPDFFRFFYNPFWVYMAIMLFFIREFSEKKINLSRSSLNPAQLFIATFGLLVVLGTVFLLLPNATHSGISIVDALFTATSAVCVTGLTVVDTANYFTEFGQIVILVLIQIGGIGIMTFASYFSYFFKGGSTYKNQLLLRDMTNSEKIGEVFQALKKVLFLTFFIEILGAVLIYFSISSTLETSVSERIYFSIFHAISGFCNAGFSTLSNGLFEPGFQFNYSLHLIIASLFILGSIGFPIIFNLFKYLKFYILKKVGVKLNEKPINLMWIVNLNTRIILVTTFFLVIGGTFLFFIFEYSNSLEQHSFFGKLVTSFFGTTARTSGFNTFDTGGLNLTTLMLLMLLMWIGASPASAGGGIKTSTFAIACLNIINIAKGNDRIEVYGREIADVSVRRSFAIIVLSVISIGMAVFFLSLFEKDFSLLSIIFESVSAYSTTGYSMGITPQLGDIGKLIITMTMFLGRITMLTVLIAFLKKMRYSNYRYPSEEILIN